MINELTTILGLVGLAAFAMWMLPSEAKDVVVAVVSGLLGYLAKGVHDGGRKVPPVQDTREG